MTSSGSTTYTTSSTAAAAIDTTSKPSVRACAAYSSSRLPIRTLTPESRRFRAAVRPRCPYPRTATDSPARAPRTASAARYTLTCVSPGFVMGWSTLHRQRSLRLPWVRRQGIVALPGVSQDLDAPPSPNREGDLGPRVRTAGVALVPGHGVTDAEATTFWPFGVPLRSGHALTPHFRAPAVLAVPQ